MTQQRRDEIIQAAQEIVSEYGIEAVSVRSVARRAGIGASTLRHYFPTQGDLYDVLLEPAVARMLADLQIDDRRLPAGRRLVQCLMQYFPEEFVRPEEMALWFSSYTAAVGPTATERGARTLERMITLSRDRIASWLELLEEEDALLVDRDSALRFLLTTLDGICIQLITPGTVFLPEHVRPTVERAVDAVVS